MLNTCNRHITCRRLEQCCCARADLIRGTPRYQGLFSKKDEFRIDASASLYFLKKRLIWILVWIRCQLFVMFVYCWFKKTNLGKEALRYVLCDYYYMDNMFSFSLCTVTHSIMIFWYRLYPSQQRYVLSPFHPFDFCGSVGQQKIQNGPTALCYESFWNLLWQPTTN